MAHNQQNEEQAFQEEYKLIKRDVRKVIITNLLIIALLIGLFFADQKLGFLNKLERLF